MFLSCSFPFFFGSDFYNSANGKRRGGTRHDATPTPRGIVICSLYERPIVKATRRWAALAELFYRKGYSYAPFYDNVKPKVHPWLDESLFVTLRKASQSTSSDTGIDINLDINLILFHT